MSYKRYSIHQNNGSLNYSITLRPLCLGAQHPYYFAPRHKDTKKVFCVPPLSFSSLTLMLIFPLIGLIDTLPFGTVQAENRLWAISPADSMESYWKLLVKSPRRGPVLDRVWTLFADSGCTKELLQRCEQLLHEHSDDVNVWLLSGLILAKQGDQEGALTAFEVAARLNPSDYHAFEYGAELSLEKGYPQQAAQWLEKGITSTLDHLNYAEQLRLTKNLVSLCLGLAETEKALEHTQHLERAFPSDLAIKCFVAEVFGTAGYFDEALKRYDQLIELVPNDIAAQLDFILARAEIQIRLGKPNEAGLEFDEILDQLAPESPIAHSARNRWEKIFRRQSNLKGLAEYDDQRLRNHPDEVETIQRLAIVRMELGEFEEAEKGFERLDQLTPHQPELIIRWGKTIWQNPANDDNARKNHAVRVWKKLLVGYETDVSRLTMLINLLAEYGLSQTAEMYYQKLTELTSDSPETHQSLGILLYDRLATFSEREGDIPATIRYRQEHTKRSPTPENHQRLFALYQRNNDPQRAESYYWEAIFSNMTLAEHFATIDWAMAAEQYQFAERILAKVRESSIAPATVTVDLLDHQANVLETSPYWEILYRQGEITFRLGRWEESQRHFAQLRQQNLPTNTTSISFSQRRTSDTAKTFRLSVASLSWPKGEQAKIIRNCFDTIRLPESLLLFSTLCREDFPLTIRETEDLKPQFRPENYGDAVWASWCWELKIHFARENNQLDDQQNLPLGENDKSRGTELLQQIREYYSLEFNSNEEDANKELKESPIKTISPDGSRSLWYERVRRRLALEVVLFAWEVIQKNTSFQMDSSHLNTPGNMRSINECSIEGHSLQYWLRVLGFLAPFNDLDTEEYRDDCYRLLIQDLSRKEVNSFLESYDLDNSLKEYYPKPIPTLSKEELAFPPEESILGKPQSLYEQLTWMITYLEEMTRQNDARRKQSLYRKISFDIYSRQGQVMDFVAPVFSTHFRVSDYYFLKESLDVLQEVKLSERFDRCIETIVEQSPDLALNGAYVALTRSNILLNATESYLLQFNPYLIFSTEYNGLQRVQFWLDHLCRHWKKTPQQAKQGITVLDDLFCYYLLAIDGNHYKLEELPLLQTPSEQIEELRQAYAQYRQILSNFFPNKKIALPLR